MEAASDDGGRLRQTIRNKSLGVLWQMVSVASASVVIRKQCDQMIN